MGNQGAPLNYFFHAYGPAAQSTLMLDWVFTGICIAVCVIIIGLLWHAIAFRRPAQDEHALKDGGDGPKWIAIGTGFSVVVLFAMAIYAMVALDDVATPAHEPILTITVTGYDWWWKADYENPDPAKYFETANEIHIPVGVPVLIELKSMDVIHAFWVPQLAGKTEMIPGLLNRQWLEADSPGIYRGQCTQFCGVQHAHMAFDVVAQNARDFEAWENAQRSSAKSPINPEAIEGSHLFMNQCSGCHTVRGTGAVGQHAPDLTHVMSRRMIGAGLLPTNGANLMDWIAHAQELKPGARMPDTVLSPQDSAALSAYLSTLE